MPPFAGARRRTLRQRFLPALSRISQAPNTSLSSAASTCVVSSGLTGSKSNAAAGLAASIAATRTRPRMPLFLLRRIGRLGDRRQRRLARGPGEDVVDHELVHRRARRFARRAEMREQDDMVHVDQFL